MIAIVAVLGLWRGFERYKQLQVSNEQRNFNIRIAETAIDLAHRASAEITWVRRPFIDDKEIKQLGNEWGVDDQKQVRQDPRFLGNVSLMRLSKVTETFSKLEALMPKFKIVFGDDQPLRDLVDVKEELTKTGVAALYVNLGTLEHARFIIYLREVDSDDEVKKRIQNIVDAITDKSASALRP